MSKKPKRVALEDVGGSFDWTDEGITIFIPQELVQGWEAAAVDYDEATESIIIERED